MTHRPGHQANSNGDDGGGSALPDWLDNLKVIATADGGPVAWVRRRITEFIVGLAVGTAARVGATTLGAWLWIRSAITDAGAAVGGSFAYIGGGGLWLSAKIGSVFIGVNEFLGPFAIFVWVALGVGFAVVIYYLGRALIAAIPTIGTALETLLPGG